MRFFLARGNMADPTDTIFKTPEEVKTVLDAARVEGENSRGAEDADYIEEEDDAEAVEGGGEKRGKSFFNIIAVQGAELPSESAKYAGNSPSIAATKAARRIWKRSQTTTFAILMRKASQAAKGRVLYKYDAIVSERTEPSAFFTIKVPHFVNADGTASEDVSKRIRIVRRSDNPIYGFIDKGTGNVHASPTAIVSDAFTLQRKEGTNTLTLALGDEDIPTKIGPASVIRSDYEIKVKRAKLSEDETEQYDVAGAAKERAKEIERAAKAKSREHAAKAKEKQREAARREKEKAKAVKEKASLKAAKEKEKATTQKAKARQASAAKSRTAAPRAGARKPAERATNSAASTAATLRGGSKDTVLSFAR